MSIARWKNPIIYSFVYFRMPLMVYGIEHLYALSQPSLLINVQLYVNTDTKRIILTISPPGNVNNNYLLTFAKDLMTCKLNIISLFRA